MKILIKETLNVGYILSKPYVLLSFYKWFLLSTFNLPIIGYLEAFGVMLTISLLIRKTIDTSSYHYKKTVIKNKDLEAIELGEAIAKYVILVFVYIIGFILQMFM